MQVVSVHYIDGSDGDVRVTFSGPVNVADWTAGWLQLDDTGNWIVGETVVQETATSLLFNSLDFPSGLGSAWQLSGHPVGLAPPFSGALV